MNSLVVQTAIGLVFVFAIFSVFVSIITEAITRFIGLRGEYLLRGLRTMLDGGGNFTLMPAWLTSALNMLPGVELPRPSTKKSAATSLAAMAAIAAHNDKTPQVDDAWVSKIVNHPLVQVSSPRATVPDAAGNAKLTRKQRRAIPSYLSGRVFARTLVDLLVPDSSGHTTMDMIRSKIAGLPTSIPLRAELASLAADASSDVDKFRSGVEVWYDAHMDRVSGWYKRHVRWVSLGIGAVLVVLFNLNVFAIGRELYTDQGVRSAIVRQAAHAVRCDPTQAKKCLAVVENNLNKAEVAGLPIGWHTATSCALPKAVRGQPVTARVVQRQKPQKLAHPCTNWFERTGLIDAGKGVGHNIGVFLLVLVGWLLMVVALLPGARFWFDLLGRLGSLRSTGPKPAKTTAAAAN